MLEGEIVEIIMEEEGVVKDTHQSLVRQREEIQQRFRTESGRARELTSELVGTRRAEEKVQIASDEAISHALTDLKVSEFAVIDQLIENPYFARFKVREEKNGRETEFEYKLGNKSNTECRIIDWRKAPIAKLYYEYKEGDSYSEIIQDRDREGVVLLRHSVEVEKDQLKRISCKLGSFKKSGTNWEKQSGPDRASKSRADGLPTILSLITPEQFRMITEEASTAVLIQGIAGSGKTTVAMHRLAWLLHEDNSDLKAEEALVLVYSNVLKNYVAKTLPAMEIHGVQVLTFGEWALKSLENGLNRDGEALRLSRPSESVSTSVARVKGSMALLCALEEYVSQQSARVLSHLETSLPWDGIPTGVRGLFDQITQRFKSNPRSPILAAIEEIKSGLSKSRDLPPSHPRASKLDQANEIISSTERRVKLYREDLLSILRQPDPILRFDETHLLDKNLIALAYNSCNENFAKGLLDPSDDPLLLYLIILKTGFVPFLESGSGRYRHIVLDEVQDFSPLALACVVGSVERRDQLTLVGDTAQEISGSFPGWEKLKQHWGLDDDVARFITLAVSHRSTVQIMRLADAVTGEKRTETGRDGKLPTLYRVEKESEGIAQALEWLLSQREEFPNTITAVICGTVAEAKEMLSMLEPTFGGSVRLGDEDSFSFDSGIIVTDVRQVKGLEFFSVLIWNPSEKSYADSSLGRNLLYVAITRAEENLAIIAIRKGTSSLLSRAKEFLRIVSIDQE